VAACASPTKRTAKLEARAALAGLSLSEFLLREVQALVDRPSLPELQARLAASTDEDPRFGGESSVRRA